jgi:hypothetical protein
VALQRSLLRELQIEEQRCSLERARKQDRSVRVTSE